MKSRLFPLIVSVSGVFLALEAPAALSLFAPNGIGFGASDADVGNSKPTITRGASNELIISTSHGAVAIMDGVFSFYQAHNNTSSLSYKSPQIRQATVAANTWYRIAQTATLTANIAQVALTSNVATITTQTAHNITVGSTVSIAVPSSPVFEGTSHVVASVPSPKTFTFARANADITPTPVVGTARVTAPLTSMKSAAASGLFTIRGNSSGINSTVQFRAGIHGSQSGGIGFTLLENSVGGTYSNTISRVRFVTSSSSDRQFLEVLTSPYAANGEVECSIADNVDQSSWEPVAWQVAPTVAHPYYATEYKTEGTIFAAARGSSLFGIDSSGSLFRNGIPILDRAAADSRFEKRGGSGTLSSFSNEFTDVDGDTYEVSFGPLTSSALGRSSISFDSDGFLASVAVYPYPSLYGENGQTDLNLYDCFTTGRSVLKSFRGVTGSSALGDSKVSGSYSTAVGQSKIDNLYSSIDFAFAAGSSIVTKHYGTAFGDSLADGYGSIAGGLDAATTFYASGAVALGEDVTAFGYNSVAIGRSLEAATGGSVVLGGYNVTAGNRSQELFVLGNGTGTSDSARSNAMTVLKNGNVGIGTTSPGQKLSVSGDVKITGALILGVTTGDIPAYQP